jgi:uncharacterized protein (DUF1778 family)
MQTSLLIHLSKKEAQEVRGRAQIQRRTVSGYVMNIVLRRIEFADEIASNAPIAFKLTVPKQKKTSQPRTTLHIYCSVDEANRVRRSARLGRTTIGGFILNSLRHSWSIEDSLAEMQRETRLRRRSL